MLRTCLPLFLAVLLSCCEGETALPRVERRFPIMGTSARILLIGEENTSMEKLEKAAGLIQARFREIETMCNIYDPASELSRINLQMQKGPVKCSPELWELLMEAKRFHEYSSGAFDVTVKPLMSLWGFHRKKAELPSAEKIRAVRRNTGLDKVRFSLKEHTVFAPPPGNPQFDPGGIAKGFALDKAAELLREHGIKRGLLDLGGNIRCLGLPPEKNRKSYRIGIRDPFGGHEPVEIIEMTGNTIATSGNYERYVVIGGVRYTHIMDPRTGLPVSGVLSVSVVTPRGVDSDALSTSVFILGEAFAEKVCRDFPETHILLFRQENGKLIRRAYGTIWQKEKDL